MVFAIASEFKLDYTFSAAASLAGGGTASNSMLQFALWTGLAVILVATLMLGVVILLRVRLLVRQRRERRFTEQWRPLLVQCVEAVPEHLPPVARANRQTLIKLWNYYYESLRGAAQHNLRQIAFAAGIDVIVRTTMTTGSLRERLIAITTLGHLGDKSLERELRLAVADLSPLLSLAAARALLEIDAAMALVWLPSVIAAREDWPMPRVAAMLADAGAHRATQPLAAAAEAAAAGDGAWHQVPRLLRLLEVAHVERAAPAIHRILRGARDERVIAACLLALHDPREVDTVRGFLAHPAWAVRMAAVRALGRVAVPEDRKRFADLLSDPHWWVRYHAAKALIELPFVSVAELAKIRAVLPDCYAADMLGQVIAEQP